MRTLRTVMVLAAHDLRMLFIERGAAFARLVLPIVFIIVVGIANDAFESGEDELPVMELVDLDGSDFSHFFLRYVAERATAVETCGESFEPSAPERGVARPDGYEGRLEAGNVDIALVVPDGFADALRADGQPPVRLVFARNDPREASRLLPLVQSAAQRVSIAASADEAAVRLLADEGAREQAERVATSRALEVLAQDRVTVTRESLSIPERPVLVGFQQSVPGMGSMFVMLSVLAGAAMLVEERSRWTLQRTLTAPVSYAAFVSGKIVGRFLIGTFQYLLAVITGLVIGELVGIDFGSSPVLMAAVMASFVLAMAGLSVLLATLVRREQQANGLTTLLAVTLAPLGGAWWSLDIEIVPDVMRQIARISPFYWVMEGFRAAIHDLGWGEALPSIAVLLGSALLTGVLAIRRLARFHGS